LARAHSLFRRAGSEPDIDRTWQAKYQPRSKARTSGGIRAKEAKKAKEGARSTAG
jgi:hypothetical protein